MMMTQEYVGWLAAVIPFFSTKPDRIKAVHEAGRRKEGKARFLMHQNVLVRM